MFQSRLSIRTPPSTTLCLHKRHTSQFLPAPSAAPVWRPRKAGWLNYPIILPYSGARLAQSSSRAGAGLTALAGAVKVRVSIPRSRGIWSNTLDRIVSTQDRIAVKYTGPQSSIVCPPAASLFENTRAKLTAVPMQEQTDRRAHPRPFKRQHRVSAQTASASQTPPPKESE
jgi:hypothetical protein